MTICATPNHDLNTSLPGVPVTLETHEKTVDVIDHAQVSASADIRGLLTHTTQSYFTVASMLEELASERQNWECNELAASHARLYGILSKCYDFYLTLKSADTDKSVRKTMMGGLEMFIQQQGLKTLAETHDMNKVVKAVFGDDRRRVSAYAMALRVALTAGPGAVPIAASALAGWIEKSGGVEEIRLGGKNKGLTEKERAETAKSAVESAQPLLTIKPDAKVMSFGTNDADKMMVLLATYRPTGDLEVNGVVKNDSAVRAALAAYYADNKKDLADIKLTKQQTGTSAILTALSE